MPKNIISDKQDLKDFCWSSLAGKARYFHISSGTTGVPALWARGQRHLTIGTQLYGRVIEQEFGIKKNQNTLAIICFNFSGWVASQYTLVALHELVQREKYNLCIYPSGPEIANITRYIEQFDEMFDNVVIIGVPVHVEKLFQSVATLPKRSAHYFSITSGQKAPFSWKQSVSKMIGPEQVDHHLSVYGSADAGLIAYESQLALAVTQYAFEAQAVLESLLAGVRDDRPWVLMQYDPQLIEVNTSENNELLLNLPEVVIPLQRYRTGDIGRIITADEMKKLAQDFNFPVTLQQKLKENDLPFMVFLGRETLWLGYDAFIRLYVDDIQQVVSQLQVRYPNITGAFAYEVETCVPHSVLKVTLVVDPYDNEDLASLHQTFLSLFCALNPEVQEAYNKQKILVSVNGVDSLSFISLLKQAAQQQADMIYYDLKQKPRYVTYYEK